MFLLNLIGSIIGIILGGYILFVGRKNIWITLGVVSLLAIANLLAVLVAGKGSVQDLLQTQNWTLLGIAFLAGILSLFLGRARPDLGVALIGFIAGADMALWLYEISAYLITSVAQFSEQTAFRVGLLILFIGGLLGLWFVRKFQNEALIIITMVVGTQVIQSALGLSPASSWTAIIVLSLAVGGVLVQYATYLREIKSNELSPAPQPSSVAYFQDLELDL